MCEIKLRQFFWFMIYPHKHNFLILSSIYEVCLFINRGQGWLLSNSYCFVYVLNFVIQAIDEYIIQDLEQMEKESDIDDILSYRSVAELKLQVFVILTYGNYSAECYQLIYLDWFHA